MTERPPISGGERQATPESTPDKKLRLVEKPPTKSLVMWSGGLDSTFCVARVLQETDDEVFVHHVHCNLRGDHGASRSQRCEYEANACAAMLPILRSHYRAFTYTESRVDLSGFVTTARDSATVMYLAAQAALSHGFTPFDRIVFGANADEDRRWQPGSELYALRRMVTIRVLKGVWESDEVPYLYLPNPRPTRAQELEFLPAQLSSLRASCRNPLSNERGFGDSRYFPCGRCSKCETMARSIAEQDVDGTGATVNRLG